MMEKSCIRIIGRILCDHGLKMYVFCNSLLKLYNEFFTVTSTFKFSLGSYCL